MGSYTVRASDLLSHKQILERRSYLLCTVSSQLYDYKRQLTPVSKHPTEIRGPMVNTLPRTPKVPGSNLCQVTDYHE
jgi:hypothetical protein